MQSHQEVINIFIKDIFRGKYKNGERLPTEKMLTESFGVDRGALRVALKQLESMGLLNIRQGDGIYVNDYIHNAGIDFLRALFLLEETGGKKDFLIDDYLVDELWEFWILLFPAVVELATRKYSNRDLRILSNLLDEEAKNLNDREKVIELELNSHDVIVDIVDNTVITLLFNSCRPLRKKMVVTQINGMTVEELTEHIESKRKLIKMFSNCGQDEVKVVIAAFRERMEVSRKKGKE